MAWFGNIKQSMGEKIVLQLKKCSRHFFTIETLLLDLIFTIDGKNSNPVFFRELYTHSPIK